MLIRPVVQEDIDEIAAIEKNSPSPWSQTLIESELSYSLGIQLAACQSTDAKILGWCCARFLEPEAELLKIATSSLHRRKGIATNILKKLFLICREKHCSTLYIEVREQNVAALTLYKSLGFTMHSRRENYFNAPTDNCLVLIKYIITSNV